jgi:hypothetical protein
MQISLRSQLVAGTAAIVGASAIAMTPVMGAQLSLPSVQVPSAVAVTLTGLDSPISELLATLELANTYLLNATLNPTPANPLDSPWAFAGFGAGIPVFPTALAAPEAGGYTSVGLLPQIIDDALPIISQLGYNGSDYLNVTGDALFGAGIGLSEGIWNAAGAVLTLDFGGAINDLLDGINTAGTLLLGAGIYVLSNVVAHAEAVINSLVAGIPTLLGVGLAQVGVVVNKVVQVVTDTFAAATFEDGWNAAVDGIFGPSGVPGTILNLTIGAGVQTVPITAVAPLTPADAFIPSTRTVVQGLVKEIAADLTYFVPAAPVAAAPAAAKSARSAAAVRSAAVAAPAAAEAPAAEASAAEAPAGEAPAAAESSAPAEKKAGQRSARGASKRAAAAN